MKLTFLGTSAAWPSARRNNVAFVAHSRQPVLFECGPGVLYQLAVAGIDPGEIRTVILSHIHGDHSLGLPMFLIAAQIAQRTVPLTVCLPESGVEPMKRLCSTVYPSLGPLIKSLVEWLAMPEKGSASIELPGQVKARTAAAVHPVPAVATSLDFQPEGRTLAFSGDTAYCEGVARNASGVDLLIHEANWSETLGTPTGRGHSTAAEAGAIARLAKAGQLALVHTTRELAERGKELAAEAGAQFGGEVFVPDDFTMIEL